METQKAGAMNGVFGGVVDWFLDPVNWNGVDGVPSRLWEHVQISLLALVLSVIIAVPVAVWLAHHQIGGSLVVAAVNVGRAVPSFAVVAVALPITIQLGLGLGFWPTMIALLFLGIPPLFSNTHAGVMGVDPALVDAGSGMGMTATQVMTQVEVPLAMPVILARRENRCRADCRHRHLGGARRLGWTGPLHHRRLCHPGHR
jgi:osmoprotectant transport system permease protein